MGNEAREKEKAKDGTRESGQTRSQWESNLSIPRNVLLNRNTVRRARVALEALQLAIMFKLPGTNSATDSVVGTGLSTPLETMLRVASEIVKLHASAVDLMRAYEQLVELSKRLGNEKSKQSNELSLRIVSWKSCALTSLLSRSGRP